MSNNTPTQQELEGIVLGISEVKPKEYTFGNKTVVYDMRYIRVEVPFEGQVLIRMQDKYFVSLPKNKDGQEQIPRNGDTVKFEHFDKEFKFNDGRMLTNPQIVTILSHMTTEAFETYKLANIYFYDWGVQLKNEHSKCSIPKDVWNQLTGIETSFMLNKLKDKIKTDLLNEATIQLKTVFKVYPRWDMNNTYLIHNNGEPIILTVDNLNEIRKVVAEETEVTRMRLIMEEIKLKLQNQMFLTTNDITELVRKYTIPEGEIQQYVKNIVWKKDYDEDYTNWLHEKAKDTLYGYEGLFYIIDKLTVLEDPEPNMATYIFIGTPDYIASNIEAIRKEACRNGWREVLYRLKKSDPEKLNWFVGRVPHHNKEQWTRDMESLLKAANDQSMIMKFSDDPKRTNTSAARNLVKTHKFNKKGEITE